MSAEIIKGLILQVYEFQEKDLIVKTITNKRIFSFVALGTRKPESKNKFALLESSISELEIFLSRLNNKLSKLKKATTEISLDLNNSKILEFWRFISFFLNKLEKTSNYFFENLKLAWEIINEQNYLHIVVFLLANHLVLQGHFISFNKCVKCMKNKNLIYFNFL
ncbi:recombination protein O N-terminal domain-containing protein [Mesomycoplasma hyorhinis]|uniref:recombination protein O N-terminal domain-containing protein n=1 Tax=Mesomycoplasma hyorhinis TaxID=2100 RepID=UPI00280651D5|nr:recombination protein O N-terminal domain-containing protein [Mesomycoplasma hyorhinis]